MSPEVLRTSLEAPVLQTPARHSAIARTTSAMSA
jgi:hypothetical protein